MTTMHKLAHILKYDKDRMFDIIEEMEERFGNLE